jgi:preprotein translocase subunit SecA
VVVVPPNRPLKRKDLPDCFFLTAEEQFKAALAETLRRHACGQPVLIVTATIQDTEIISRMLVDEHVPHSVLNANNAYWEAEIIKEAGQKGAVTVSTGMAGRGTDIKLGAGVAELGGLAVLGVGRMENTRLERQARGRAGRQGDPGSSQFFVSAEDEIVSQMFPEKAKALLESRRSVSERRIRRLIARAQKTIEEQSISSREQAVRYDEILRRQREILYGARNRLLDGEAVPEDEVRSIVHGNLKRFVEGHRNLDANDLKRYILDHLSYELDEEALSIIEGSLGQEELLRRLTSYADGLYQKKAATFASMEERSSFTRACMLKALDEGWVEEVDYLQQLQYAITSRGTAQRNPIFEYSKEAYRSFEEMKRDMMEHIARNFFLAEPQAGKHGKRTILFP